MRRIWTPNAVKQDSVPPEQIYFDDRLIRLMDFKNPAALVDAARAGNADLTWLLLTRSDVSIEATDQYGRTSLSWAAEQGHENIAKLLLGRGAATETKDALGETPLLRATKAGHESIVKLLLNRGAATETKDALRRTPLSRAAGMGYENIVQLLLNEDAATETTDRYNRTPVSWAAAKGHENIVKLLLEAPQTRQKTTPQRRKMGLFSSHFSREMLQLRRRDQSDETPARD